MQRTSKVFVAGHKGMVGSAITCLLEQEGFTNRVERSSAELDLRDREATESFFREEQPEYVFLAAAKAGGIGANLALPAAFLHDNLLIETNILQAAFRQDVKKLLFVGSSCIYPRNARQPITEEYLMTGPLEPSVEYYATAKIAGIQLCRAYRRQHNCNFISVVPTNLYGIGDKYDLNNSHVLPAMIRRFHEAKLNGAKELVIWGSGTPKREFLFGEDFAEACLFLMHHYDEDSWINVGTGSDISIADLAVMIRDITGFEGNITYDREKPDGVPRKLLDVSKLNNLGWKHKTSLEEGIRKSYEDYLKRNL